MHFTWSLCDPYDHIHTDKHRPPSVGGSSRHHLRALTKSSEHLNSDTDSILRCVWVHYIVVVNLFLSLFPLILPSSLPSLLPPSLI